MSESNFKVRVQKDLKQLDNVWFVKTNNVSLLGIPDLLLSVQGFFVALELKKDTKSKISKIQLYNIDTLTRKGSWAFVTYPENWPEIYSYLKELSESKDPYKYYQFILKNWEYKD